MLARIRVAIAIETHDEVWSGGLADAEVAMCRHVIGWRYLHSRTARAAFGGTLTAVADCVLCTSCEIDAR